MGKIKNINKFKTKIKDQQLIEILGELKDGLTHDPAKNGIDKWAVGHIHVKPEGINFNQKEEDFLQWLFNLKPTNAITLAFKTLSYRAKHKSK